MKVAMISLGCPKNLTDAEVILGKLACAGFEITNAADDADIIIINTCAFIKSAKEESIDAILDAAQKKRHGQKLIVAGCLPQRYKRELTFAMPEVDGWIGSGSISNIVKLVNAALKSGKPGRSEFSNNGSCLFNEKTPRIKATPPWYAYIKIADGCDNRCSYCAIPAIRGRFKSRPMASIVSEAKDLARDGVKELILTAHDTTMWGKDIWGKSRLPELLKKLARVKGIRWIRLMYAHPAHITDKLIKIIAAEPKICKYLDLPIQHSCDRILRLMGRGAGKEEIETLINKLRRSIPGIAIRTSLIVGFPTESEEDFRQLVDFIKKIKFERLGVFEYSDEDETRAFKMRGKVPERVKKSRFRELMRIQNRISKELNKKMIGKKIEVLAEKNLKRSSVGRSMKDAPDIDGSVSIKNSIVSPGKIVEVKICSASAYDLAGYVSP